MTRMRALVVITLVVAVAARDNYYRLPAPYSYSCQEQRNCVRTERSEVREYQSLDTCQLTCGEYGALFPEPTGETILSKTIVAFMPQNLKVKKIAVSDQKVSDMLDEATHYFARNLHYLHPEFPDSQKKPFIDEPESNTEYDSRFKNEYRQNPEYRHRTDISSENVNPLMSSRKAQRYVQYSPFVNVRPSAGVDRHNFDLEITVTSPEHKLYLETDESYVLQVTTAGDTTTASINAPTYFGARHALETLSQLIAYKDETDSLQVVSDAKITDEPEFKYRGFMLDTGRNFYKKDEILRLLDTMSYNKMNYFNWHINDAASFPMYSNRLPEMTYYGAYSPKKVYYPEDIKEIVEYARLRGINVIPELDAPGHTSAGWDWGEKEGKGKLVLCTDKSTPWFDQSKEPPSGQINPVNPEVYPVLGELYRDMMEYFDPEMIHMGGDGVSFKCWQNSPEITEYLAANNLEPISREFFELWNTFQSNAYAKLKEAAGEGRKITPIIHSSSFARNYVDKNAYIIQLNEVADQSAIADYVNNGYKVIFSNDDAWSLDCQGNRWFGEKTQNCRDQPSTWEHFYKNSPMDMLLDMGLQNARADLPPGQEGNPKNFVLGGTVSMWSSETDSYGFSAKAWPKVSGMAERMWTDKPLARFNLDDVQKRLNVHRERMVHRGVRANPLQPEYCLHDQAACYSQEQYTARTNTPHQQAQ